MSCFPKKVDNDLQTTSGFRASKTSATSCGRDYSCECNGKKVSGLVTLALAAIALIFAIIFAAGVFGGGKMGLIAGGLTVTSMMLFAISCVLLAHKQDMPIT